MKIGLIISELRNGGGSYQLLNLAQQLKSKGNEVTIYTLSDSISKSDPSLVRDLKIKSCNFIGKVENRPHSQIVGVVLYILYLIKINYILFKIIRNDELDLLNPHEWPVQWAAVLIKFIKKIPVIWMCNDVWHLGTIPDSRILFRIVNKSILHVLDIIFTSKVDKITVLDNRIAGIIKKHYHTKPVVVRSGVDLDKFTTLPSRKKTRSKLEIGQSEFIFLCLSIFMPHRRFQDAVKAFKILKTENKNKLLKLYIVGSDAYEPIYSARIRQLIRDNKLQDDVILRTDYISSETLRDYLIASDVFIFPNEKQTWGLIVTEAMACGRPCIVSDEAGVHEVIEHKYNGLVFKVKDVKDLESNMALLLQNSNLRDFLGGNAQKYIYKNLSWRNYAEHMLSVFRDVIKEK